jgi:hypothetical protein
VPQRLRSARPAAAPRLRVVATGLDDRVDHPHDVAVPDLGDRPIALARDELIVYPTLDLAPVLRGLDLSPDVEADVIRGEGGYGHRTALPRRYTTAGA